jgi:hypothetical protein
VPADTKSRVVKRKHRPVGQSDWARLAYLRSDWTPTADTIVVAHHQTRPTIDLSALGVPLLKGSWEMEVRVDNERVAFPPEWSCSCWYSDSDCDYLELSAKLAPPLHVERQILLARQARFAILADAVSGAGSSSIDLLSRLPLATDVKATADAPTRECVLSRTGVAARAFPLSLPRNRVNSAAGTLAPQGADLELSVSSRGGLFAPIVLDWAPWRQDVDADWRVLTVTQDAVPLASDAAVGTRLRVGAYQMLVYRSFVKSEIPRAVLGLHTSHETVIGRFTAAGNVDPILLVE